MKFNWRWHESQFCSPPCGPQTLNLELKTLFLQYYVADRHIAGGAVLPTPSGDDGGGGSSTTYLQTLNEGVLQYYVADRHIAPAEHAPFFSERLAMLPECFLGPSHRLTHQVSSICIHIYVYVYIICMYIYIYM